MNIKIDVVLYERLDRVKLDTGRRSALFERGDEGIILKGTFVRLKISEKNHRLGDCQCLKKPEWNHGRKTLPRIYGNKEQIECPYQMEGIKE